MTCLSVSTDGSVLLSGSHDESVRLWDVKSKQCLRTVTLKGVPEAAWPHRDKAGPCPASQAPDVVLLCPSGPVTNAAIILAPPSMLNPEFRPSLPLPHFNKHLLGAEHGDEAQGGGLRLQLGLHLQVGPTATLLEHSILQSSFCCCWCACLASTASEPLLPRSLASTAALAIRPHNIRLSEGILCQPNGLS